MSFPKKYMRLDSNILGFLREMVYEDMPFTNHPDIDDECIKVLGY